MDRSPTQGPPRLALKVGRRKGQHCPPVQGETNAADGLREHAENSWAGRDWAGHDGKWDDGEWDDGEWNDGADAGGEPDGGHGWDAGDRDAGDAWDDAKYGRYASPERDAWTTPATLIHLLFPINCFPCDFVSRVYAFFVWYYHCCMSSAFYRAIYCEIRHVDMSALLT